MSEQKSALEVALENLEKKFGTTETVRSTITEKLKSAINQMSLDFNGESPRSLEVKLAALKTLDDLLRSSESSAVTAAKTQMQKKNDESSESARQLVVEMLRNISMKELQNNSGSGVSIPTAAAVTAAVSKACNETKHPIEDTELSVPEVPLKQ